MNTRDAIRIVNISIKYISADDSTILVLYAANVYEDKNVKILFSNLKLRIKLSDWLS